MAMPAVIQGSGGNSDVPLQVDPTYNAARVSLRPIEFNIGGMLGGHYAITSISGTMAAGLVANSQIWQIRWAPPNPFVFILKSMSIQAATSTAFTTLFGADVELVIGHGSTANGSGGNPQVPNGTSNRMRNNMNASNFVTSGEIRVASTGALTPATGQTLEPYGIGYAKVAPFTINTLGTKVVLYDQVDNGDHPCCLATGDSVVLRVPNPGATGVWSFGVQMECVEAATY